MTGRIVKRSVAIAGHRTSVSLEDVFWSDLRTLASQRRLSTASLIAEIDGARRAANLSSALRLYVLAEAKRGAFGATVTAPAAPTTA